MGNPRYLYLDECAIKGLPCSIGHLTGLAHLKLENCRNLRSLPDICGLKSLEDLVINGCSNLEAFSEITEDMEQLKHLLLRETGITELPSSIEHLRGLGTLELTNCENLVALPNSIGSLTCLTLLRVRNCTKLHNLPDNLRGLQCCLKELDLGCCNLTDREIPSDLWMKAHSCPCLETETFSVHFGLLCSNTSNQQFRDRRFVIPGSSGIPEWVSHQRMGCEVRIELPMNWYEDNNFLGFVLFFHHVPLDDDECETTEVVLYIVK
ncbi:Disease resistance-like protein DSC1 [Vitis vinifera]|uniref:Disease resistance-like protein DSC1 n=1 Tax=Vitis vinifera TaxID=29760 RepID=A0A438HEL8_VITVI|nr:Disease resistance-like protein DSC1 [Vitis vinifera]